VDILSTLTPADYLAFRDQLGRALGLRSRQYRLLEFAMGNKNAEMIRPFAHLPEVASELTQALAHPSLYDEAINLLARRGLTILESVLGHDFARPYEPQASVETAWREVYQDVARHWELYKLAEDLVDVVDWFQQWRFRHVTTVERVIGRRRGMGGSSGVAYLRDVLDRQFFPELWSVPTSL
jgi:tryptophan 2,3-dioxygenase